MSDHALLNLVFVLHSNKRLIEEQDVVYKKAVSYWPTFKEGEIITLTIMDNSGSNIVETKHYKVNSASFIISASADKSTNLNNLCVYVTEHKVKSREDDFTMDML